MIRPEVPCTVVGVYATVHAEDGDHRAQVYKVDIDCETVTFWCRVAGPTVGTSGIDGIVFRSTLHLGVTAVTVDVTPVAMEPGGEFVVIHKVTVPEMTGREAAEVRS